MPKPPLPSVATQLLAKPNPAVIATAHGHQPVSVATRFLCENGRILVNMDEGRKRLEYIRENPLVSLTVLDVDDWYTHVSVRGRIVELANDPDMANIDRISRHYTGRPYRVRDRGRVSGWIEIEQWNGFGRLATAA